MCERNFVVKHSKWWEITFQNYIQKVLERKQCVFRFVENLFTAQCFQIETGFVMESVKSPVKNCLLYSKIDWKTRIFVTTEQAHFYTKFRAIVVKSENVRTKVIFYLLKTITSLTMYTRLYHTWYFFNNSLFYQRNFFPFESGGIPSCIRFIVLS